MTDSTTPTEVSNAAQPVENAGAVPPVATWTLEDDDQDIEIILRLLTERESGK